MSKTIIVSNRLPIRIEEIEGEFVYKQSEGGLATGLGSIYRQGDNIWIGWPGKTIDNEEAKKEVATSLREHSMRPVFLTEQEINKYYIGFSNETLWPAYHYFVQNIKFENENWEAYKAVNEKFAKAILEWLEPGDVVWVHDYQLLLVPELIRKSQPNVSIGFFQHIPFPSYEVFRMIPWRRELLKGMLGADYVCFHTYDDMRHFLSSCNRLAGYQYKSNELNVGNRLVVADSLPMGIDYEKYANSALEEETLKREERYKQSLGDQRLILSMDRLDYSKGIPTRLKAFDDFLEKHQEYIGKVSLILIVVPSRDNVLSYKNLKEEVDELVGRINGKYGRMAWTPIHYFYRSYPLNALSAFYRMCEIALITPMRDGMNLVCKEFIASKYEQDGVLILSEMAGASKELSDAILVNPNDRQQMVDAIKFALEMPLDERKRRVEILQKSLKKYSIFNWVKLFISNLNEVKERQQGMAIKKVDLKIISSTQKKYKEAKSRILFLDYDGTLVPFHKNPEACAPDPELLSLLEKFTQDKKNRIAIISGRKRETLQNWLGGLKVDLIAEHGIWCKAYKEDWKQLAQLEMSWRADVIELLNFYVDRTPGSFIEEKEYSVVWHYRKVEKGLGELRTRELTSHLRHLLMGKKMDVLDGNMVVEIKPDNVNKGIAAKKWIKTYNPDFILAAGDDRTDEDTFKAMPEEAITIKVGFGTSKAELGVDDYSEFREFLKTID